MLGNKMAAEGTVLKKAVAKEMGCYERWLLCKTVPKESSVEPA